MTAQMLAWTAGNCCDAEDTARRVSEDHGIPRADLSLRPVADGWEVWGSPRTAYFIAPDGEDEPTLWRTVPGRPDYPEALARRCTLGAETWALLETHPEVS